jgi:SAM-dependent methyltransferase
VIADERRLTVRRAYDALGAGYGEWASRIEGDPWARFLDELVARLPAGGRVLDLGCGNGEKISRLAGDFELVAVDISEEQLRLAGSRLPGATLIAEDFSRLEFEDHSFDAVTALYSVMHVPRDEHRDLFGRTARWLKPGGLFLASMSHLGGPDRAYEWLGVEMFFSGFDSETNRRLVREAGFEPVLDELVWMQEPESESAFLWVLASKAS